MAVGQHRDSKILSWGKRKRDDSKGMGKKKQKAKLKTLRTVMFLQLGAGIDLTSDACGKVSGRPLHTE